MEIEQSKIQLIDLPGIILGRRLERERERRFRGSSDGGIGVNHNRI